MASFYERSGRFYIDVYGFGRIALGKNRSDAATISRNVDRIWRTQKLGLPLDPESVRFLEETSEKIRGRLKAIGLVAADTAPTIAELVGMYERTLDVKASTSTTYQQAIRCLYEFFGKESAVRDVKRQDVLEFRGWLLRQGSTYKDEDGKPKGLARATMSRRFKTCRSIFKHAVGNRIVTENPFEGVVAGRQTNGSRSFYVSPDLTEQIFEELPTVEYRLVFALGRWLGVRIPSEVINLRWSDVNWSASSIRVFAPKTERYEGKDVRLVPIFREFLPWLEQAFEAAEDGAEFLCPHLRSVKAPGQIFTKTVKAAVRRCGVEPWPKFLINLRATRATEVDAAFGPKCESEWIGHGSDVALKSYLMETDDAWQRATGNLNATAKTPKVKLEN